MRRAATSTSVQYGAAPAFTGRTINRVAIDVSGEPYDELEREGVQGILVFGEDERAART